MVLIIIETDKASRLTSRNDRLCHLLLFFIVLLTCQVIDDWLAGAEDIASIAENLLLHLRKLLRIRFIDAIIVLFLLRRLLCPYLRQILQLSLKVAKDFRRGSWLTSAQVELD